MLSHLNHVLEVFDALLQDLGHVRIALLASTNSIVLLVILLVVLRKAGVGHQALVVILHVQSLGLR